MKNRLIQHKPNKPIMVSTSLIFPGYRSVVEGFACRHTTLETISNGSQDRLPWLANWPLRGIRGRGLLYTNSMCIKEIAGGIKMKIKEIHAKNILSKSKVFDYALNPYVGCEHGCLYCYAKFMKRFTGHREGWGEFVDAKINAPELLSKEIKKKRAGRVWISGVCDPYQPIEERYGLTRMCLKVLIENDWPVTIQTKSPLVLRDLELLKISGEVEVGLTVTTADEEVKEIFEPKAPRIKERILALTKMHSKGITTFAMIAPLLEGVEGLVNGLKGKVDYVLIDRMNYHYADRVYRKFGIEWARKDKFFIQKGKELMESFEKTGIPSRLLY
jgi:DNA repair photolyase